MEKGLFNQIFQRESTEEKILRKKTQSEQDFIRERDSFLAANSDESLTIKQDNDMSDLTRWQQDLSEEIKTLIHDLRREIKIDGVWVRQQVLVGYDKKGAGIYQELPPIVNELGIQTIISLLKPLLSRNLMMSNYNEDRILMKLRRTVSTLILHLGYNHKIYGINKTDLDAIVQMFRDIIEPTHFRSLNNGERNYLNTTTKRMENHAIVPPQYEKKKGWGVFN